MDSSSLLLLVGAYYCQQQKKKVKFRSSASQLLGGEPDFELDFDGRFCCGSGKPLQKRVAFVE